MISMEENLDMQARGYFKIELSIEPITIKILNIDENNIKYGLS